MTKTTAILLRGVAILAIAGGVYGTAQAFTQNDQGTTILAQGGGGSGGGGSGGAGGAGGGTGGTGTGAGGTGSTGTGGTGGTGTGGGATGGGTGTGSGSGGADKQRERQMFNQDGQQPGRSGGQQNRSEDGRRSQSGDNERGRDGRDMQRSQGQDRDKGDAQRSDRDKGDTQRSQGRDRSDRDPGPRGAQGSVELRGEQRTRVREIITREGSPRSRSDINVNLSVGTTLPTRVELRPVPASILAIVPEYRGYHYIYVGDEIFIVEPRTRRIVYVIDAG